MPLLLVATTSGCRVFAEAAEAAPELTSHSVMALAHEGNTGAIAIVDDQQIWRRNSAGAWSHFVTAPIPLQSIVAADGSIFVGGMEEPTMLRISGSGSIERLQAFDHTPGREQWIANGPPLGVRSLAAMPNALLAAVHVGGIPRSTDTGATWHPTIPVLYDVHQVSVPPSLPGFVAAATAVGLCISHDSGLTWTVHSEGLPITNSLAVAVLQDEVLFSIEDGPFAERSQLWRWRIDDGPLEQVREGLPEWLDGKIDTHWIATTHNQAALIDCGGNLWRSASGSTGWQHIAVIPPYVTSLLIL